MTERYSEDEAIATIPRLTRTRLVAFIEAEVVMPARSGGGYVFGQIDLARLELLCDLCEDFDLEGEALRMVISLIDQLHANRRDLRALASAIAGEPPEVRARIAAALKDRYGSE